MALAAVMTQTLLPKVGGGRIPAAELLMVGYGARQHIRKNALQHLHQEITITRKEGSFTLEESLAELVEAGPGRSKDAHARARCTPRSWSGCWTLGRRRSRLNSAASRAAALRPASGRRAARRVTRPSNSRNALDRSDRLGARRVAFGRTLLEPPALGGLHELIRVAG